MKTISATLLAALAVTAACDSSRRSIDTGKDDEVVVDEEEPVVEEPVEEEPEEEVSDFVAEKYFGAELVSPDFIAVNDFADVMANPEQFVGIDFETRGTVRQVCQVRGCWMAVRDSANTNSKDMTVRFKDYAFFMPKDSQGAEVRIQGQLHLDVLSADEVRELEAEGYDVGETEADGTVKQLLFMAYGVEMAAYN